MVAPTPSGTTVVHYDIPDALHRRAKGAAALKGVTLRQFVIDALEAAVAAEKGRNQ